MTISCDFCGNNEAKLGDTQFVAASAGPTGMTIHICEICVDVAMEIVHEVRMNRLRKADLEQNTE